MSHFAKGFETQKKNTYLYVKDPLTATMNKLLYTFSVIKRQQKKKCQERLLDYYSKQGFYVMGGGGKLPPYN